MALMTPRSSGWRKTVQFEDRYYTMSFSIRLRKQNSFQSRGICFLFLLFHSDVKDQWLSHWSLVSQSQFCFNTMRVCWLFITKGLRLWSLDTEITPSGEVSLIFPPTRQGLSILEIIYPLRVTMKGFSWFLLNGTGSLFRAIHRLFHHQLLSPICCTCYWSGWASRCWFDDDV